jgi:nitrate/nitrite transporter NarK
MALYFALMGVSIASAFGYVFYVTPNALPAFFAMVFLLGLGGANFAMYTLWIPEQYTTECRGSAIGFTSSIGRFVGCAMVFLVGAGIAYFKTLGIPVALTAAAFGLGLALLPFAEETRGKPLPV